MDSYGWLLTVRSQLGMTAFAEADEVSKHAFEMRVSGELEDVVDVHGGGDLTGGEAMLAEILVTLQRLGSYPAPFSVISTAGSGATEAISLLA